MIKWSKRKNSNGARLYLNISLTIYALFAKYAINVGFQYEVCNRFLKTSASTVTSPWIHCSRPNGWTGWAEIFWGHSGVPRGCFRLKKSIFFFIFFVFNFFIHWQRREGFHFSGTKFPFWKWNDPEICCVNRNSGIFPDQMETGMFTVYVT